MRAYLGSRIARIKGHPIYAGISGRGVRGPKALLFWICFLLGPILLYLLFH
jgi:hypothetical protein